MPSANTFNNELGRTAQNVSQKRSPTQQYILTDLSVLDSVPSAARAQILHHLIPISSYPTSALCLFLKRLPQDIRNEIYRYLVLDSDLSDFHSLQDTGIHQKQHNLSPAILLTCRQIYEEASRILYHENTFAMILGSSQYWSRGSWCYTPCMKYGLKSVDALRKVRKWKVIISTWAIHSQLHASMELFSQAVCMSPPISLELLIVPKDYEPTSRYLSNYQDLRDMLDPLRLLRKIKTFKIRDATQAEIPGAFMSNLAITGTPNPVNLPSHLEGEKPFLEELVKLVSSSATIEFLREMHNSMVSYILAFEHNFDLRSQFEHRYSSGYLTPGRQRLRSYDCSDLTGCSENGIISSLLLDGHPIKAACSDAEWADASLFKEKRCFILEYLEPQYKRIVCGATNMAEFIKREKRERATLDSQFRNSTCCHFQRRFYRCGTVEGSADIFKEGVLLIEEYWSAIKSRDMPLEMRAEINDKQKFFRCYNNSEIEIAIRRLKEEASTNHPAEPICLCFPLFKSTVNYLDERYLEIRKARKDIYKWDHLKKPGCSIGWHELPPLLDEMVNWEIDEPEIGPQVPRGWSYGTEKRQYL